MRGSRLRRQTRILTREQPATQGRTAATSIELRRRSIRGRPPLTLRAESSLKPALSRASSRKSTDAVRTTKPWRSAAIRSSSRRRRRRRSRSVGSLQNSVRGSCSFWRRDWRDQSLSATAREARPAARLPADSHVRSSRCRRASEGRCARRRRRRYGAAGAVACKVIVPRRVRRLPRVPTAVRQASMGRLRGRGRRIGAESPAVAARPSVCGARIPPPGEAPEPPPPAPPAPYASAP